MSWTLSNSASQLISDLLLLTAKAQRLALLQKLEGAKAQARAAGLPVDTLAEVQRELLRYPLPEVDRALRSPPVPPATEGLRYLTTRNNKGSRF